jgi:phosphopentomutase
MEEMKMSEKRVILIVLDSMGIGEAPDAEKFGDKGADTFGHIAERLGGRFKVPELSALGLGNIDGICGGSGKFAVDHPTGSFGRMRELSAGKDTITGHWEITGIETTTPFKTYPDGFPEEFIKTFEKAIGREVIGNYPESGTVIIEKLGDEHEKTGKPIVYTSADSVFQIAANTAVIPLEELYHICEVARGLLQGKWACGRVIARPYVIENGKRVRTSDRRDYAVTPPQGTVLDMIKAAGQEVYAVGKIHDIYNGKGISDWVHTDDNMDGVDKTLEAMAKTKDGIIFTNLVDFDSKYGHRRDPEGYGKAIMEFDARLPELKSAMRKGDIMMLTADHGNDPVHSGFDHTREYTPLVAFGAGVRAGVNLGTRGTFADIGATIADYLGAAAPAIGASFLKDILK